MITHEFEIVIDAPIKLIETVVDRLYESGCADATVCVWGGLLRLMFARAAATRHEAIISAVHDITRAKIGVNATMLRRPLLSEMPSDYMDSLKDDCEAWVQEKNDWFTWFAINPACGPSQTFRID